MRLWPRTQHRDAERMARFDEQFGKALMRSELRRVTFLAAALGLGLLVTVYALVRPESLSNSSLVASARYWVVVLVMFLAHELLVRGLLIRAMERDRRLHPAVLYVNALVEVTMPTVALLIDATLLHPIYSLFAPATFIYFIFITLSALRLDPKLSIFTGLVATAEYLIVALFHMDQAVLYSPDTYFHVSASGLVWNHLVKAAFLLAGGAATGYLTIQIKMAVCASLEAIEEQTRILGKFGEHVSPAVAEALLEQGAEHRGEARDVCVLFWDIRGFSTFSDGKSPQYIMDYLNAVFGMMDDLIPTRGGFINKYLGDGFMAVFGAPLANPEARHRAVEAGYELLRAVERVNETGEYPATRIGIGLHAGEVVTGNIGTPQRREYTVIGEVVNIAARVEALNTEFGSQFLISSAVYEDVRDDVPDAKDLGSATVKGSETPIEIYQLA
ncbi:adenylate cyclase [Candidatus Poribacteria bacterium]|nr:adenylate cyclase [Candidatus Poribacteria bacterium]